MSVRVSNLRLRLDEPEAELAGHLARLLGLARDALPPWRILRKSLDARDKDDLRFVYSAEVSADDDVLARATVGVGAERAQVDVDVDPEILPDPPRGVTEVLEGDGRVLAAVRDDDVAKIGRAHV